MSLPPLSPEQLVKPKGFELRLSAIYAAVFISLGIHLPYFPVWLKANGFDAEQIALILAAPMFLRVVTTPLIAAAADRAPERATVLVAAVAVAALVSLGYFLPVGYITVLVVSLALAVTWSAHTPLTDSLALSGVRRFGVNYPGMRIWGSISFLAANFVGGALIAAYSPSIVPVMLSVGLAIALLASLAAPRLGRPRLASPLSATDIQQQAPKLLRGSFVLFVVAAGIINGSHGFLYGFVSIYWTSLGIAEATIGLLWAWGVFTEICLFAVFDRLFGSTSPHRLIMIAGGAALLRWLVYPWIHPLGLGVPGFFAAQTLHALSVGLILIGMQKFISNTVTEHRNGAAQGIAFFANGLTMASVTLISGAIYGKLGPQGFYVMAAIALLGLMLAVMAAFSARRLK